MRLHRLYKIINLLNNAKIVLPFGRNELSLFDKRDGAGVILSGVVAIESICYDRNDRTKSRKNEIVDLTESRSPPKKDLNENG
jgi:hypothetical protein